MLDSARRFEADYERLVVAYNGRDVDQMVELIGDGAIDDPSLELGRQEPYADVATWLRAADVADDRIEVMGLGPGEPYWLAVDRTNSALEAQGIDSLALSWLLWLTQDCHRRLETQTVISRPDPCLYEELTSNGGESCVGPFEPRVGHVAVWTGRELLIQGGDSGTHEGPALTSGLAFDPTTGEWRQLATAPAGIRSWPRSSAVWTGTEMLIAGHIEGPDGSRPGVLSYDPDADAWQIAPAIPGGRGAVGAVVWTGTELLLVGGDNNYPDDTGWAYNPATQSWRQLPDWGLPPVEGVEGVWIGDRALFYGGYGLSPGAPGATYDPATDRWETLPASLDQTPQQHEMLWTGRQVIIYSGHTGPGHRSTLLRYDPATETWSASSPLPITPTERLAGVWTGDRLVIWGGLATYGDAPDSDGDLVFGEGAAYDPDTDSWSVLPPAPLVDRCGHSGTWIGDRLVVFGGVTVCGDPNIVADGTAASYDPATETWESLAP